MKSRKTAAGAVRKNTATGAGNFGRAVLLGNAAAVVLWIALLLIFSAGIKSREDPAKFIAPLGFTSTAVSSILCGIIAGKIRKESGFLTGLAAGAVFMLVLLVSSVTFANSHAGVLYRTALCLSVLLLSSIGGRLGAKHRKTVRHRART